MDCADVLILYYPAISIPPSKQDYSKVGMEQRKTIPRLHEARPGEGGLDHQEEGETSTHQPCYRRQDGGVPGMGEEAVEEVQGRGEQGTRATEPGEETRPRDIGTGTSDCDPGKKGV